MNPIRAARRDAQRLAHTRTRLRTAPTDPRMGDLTPNTLDQYGPLAHITNPHLDQALTDYHGNIPRLFYDLIHHATELHPDTERHILADLIRVPFRLTAPDAPATPTTGNVCLALHAWFVESNLHAYAHELDNGITRGELQWDPDARVLGLPPGLLTTD